MRYTLKRAAELAAASYTGKSHPDIGWQWKASLSDSGVEAHLLTDGTLLIEGSDSVRDYLRYNLRIQRLGRRRLKLARGLGSAGGVRWHQGFLAHAKIVQDWLLSKKYRPTFIIGHSLGAASTQILSAGWRVPAITFAAPRPCRSGTTATARSLCLCVNRTDDTVCNLPPSYHHLGNVKRYKPARPSPGMDHNMDHYAEAVRVGVANGTLPRVWPRR